MSESKLNDRLSRIVEQVVRMTHIIEYVSMFAREAGKPEMTDGSVNQIVLSSVDMVGTQFRTNGIDLVTTLADGLPVISASAFSLEEVLFNLLNNARDALEDAPKKNILVSTAPYDLGGITGVGVTVDDNGVGIEEADLDRVLDPFAIPR